MKNKNVLLLPKDSTKDHEADRELGVFHLNGHIFML